MTDPDITARDDELDAKMQVAGGPDALVESLVKGLRRLSFFILFTSIGVAFDVVLSIILSLVVVAVNHNNHVAQRIAWQQCTVTAADAVKINATDTSYVMYLQSLPPAATPQLRANRAGTVQIYQNAVLDVPVCGPRP